MTPLIGCVIELAIARSLAVCAARDDTPFQTLNTYERGTLDPPQITRLNATAGLGNCVLKIMRIQYSFLVVVTSIALSGCANQKESVTTTTDQTQKRVHTQEELQKTGESQTGPA